MQLWRYMDLAKFMSMIQTSTLFFSALESLSTQDKREGLFTEADEIAFDKSFERLPSQMQSSFKDAKTWDSFRPVYLDMIRRSPRQFRKTFAVNCWHAEAHESAAMWKIYSAAQYGISIRSSLNRLQRCFDSHKTDSVYVGEVLYLDYANDHIPSDNLFRPVMFKRREFKYENEVRAVVWRPPTVESWSGPDNLKTTVGVGLRVNVSLPDLIERVYVSPYSSDYLLDVVRDALAKYGLAIEVVRSTI